MNSLNFKNTYNSHFDQVSKTETSPSFKRYMEEGNHHFSAKQYTLALGAFAEASKECPMEPTCWTRIADVHCSLQQHAEAIYHYSKAILLDPENTQTLNSYGACSLHLWATKRNPKFLLNAQAFLLKANELDPKNKKTHIYLACMFSHLADLHAINQKTTDAVASLIQSLDFDDKHPIRLSNLACYQMTLKNYQEAKHLYFAALFSLPKDDPCYHIPLIGLGRIHLELKNYDQAIHYLSLGMMNSRDVEGSMRFYLHEVYEKGAFAAYENGEHRKAIHYLSHLPKTDYRLDLQAKAFEALKDHEKALEVYQEIIERHPDWEEYRDLRDNCRVKLMSKNLKNFR